MRKLSRRIAALGAFFVVAGGIAACGSGVPGNSVADVAGNPITRQAFNHWLLVVAKSQTIQNPNAPVIVPDPPHYKQCILQIRHDVPSLANLPAKQLRLDCKELFDQYAGTAMGFLISGYWYELEAAREHVKLTNAELQSAFQAAKAGQFTSAAQFDAFLTQSGQTLQDIMFRVRVLQLAQKLVTKNTKKVSASAIQNYYNANKSKFGTPESRSMRIVLTKTLSQADAAKHALQTGQSWNKVALRYSTDPQTRTTGGLVSGTTKGQLDPGLDNAAFAAPLNQLLGPVKGEFGYYVFEVTGITPATQQTLQQATPLIRQTLSGQNASNAQNALIKLLRSHWLGQTSCRPAFNLTAYCPGYKPPKTPTATGG